MTAGLVLNYTHIAAHLKEYIDGDNGLDAFELEDIKKILNESKLIPNDFHKLLSQLSSNYNAIKIYKCSRNLTIPINNLKDSISTLESVRKYMKLRLLDGIIENMNHVENEMSNYTKTIKDLQSQLQSKQNQLQNHEKEVSNYTKTIEDLQSQLQSKQNQLQNHEKEVSNYTKTIEDLRSELQSKQNQLQNHEKEVSNYTKTIEDLRSELQSKQNQLQNHEKEVSNYTKTIEDLRSELQSKQNQLQNYEKDQEKENNEFPKEFLTKVAELKNSNDLYAVHNFLNQLSLQGEKKLLLKACDESFRQFRDENGRDAFYLAAKDGNRRLVKSLVECGWNLETKTNNGWTPLIGASYNNALDSVKYLISIGADIEAKNKDGQTPLIVASIYNSVPVVKYLISAGANKEAKDNLGNTPLLAAAIKERDIVIKCLVEAGADKRAKNNDGKTARSLAKNSLTRDVLKSLGVK
ncbi:hypothetical protein TVAG_262610 [Trichomonas vaginalis G3]|uniref:Uncharacterized protein n=1 Tax=Trichomonas vaginalis (strain ATCC PRA-98 / G3) TaxID=412133 RepID=A2DUH3_TRIV3|nr:spectrin binding [Trichomonas vaginalis G3]EAY16011.1 hypothetical protein TVAG_262610 [Trichomonas vaginalis G3]KAI5523547.1 spectrin binding [Trichomonas vaginalis G3]|eukprot:XP_001328234.1 hypothetical protein [Trichomonas vaginalis G3]